MVTTMSDAECMIVQVRVYTFGSPRVGNDVFATFFGSVFQVRSRAAACGGVAIACLQPVLGTLFGAGAPADDEPCIKAQSCGCPLVSTSLAI